MTDPRIITDHTGRDIMLGGGGKTQSIPASVIRYLYHGGIAGILDFEAKREADEPVMDEIRAKFADSPEKSEPDLG